MQNPFRLYDESAAERTQARRATREFRALWKKFVNDAVDWQYRHNNIGAQDTMSREVLVDWLRKHAADVF